MTAVSTIVKCRVLAPFFHDGCVRQTKQWPSRSLMHTSTLLVLFIRFQKRLLTGPTSRPRRWRRLDETGENWWFSTKKETKILGYILYESCFFSLPFPAHEWDFTVSVFQKVNKCPTAASFRSALSARHKVTLQEQAHNIHRTRLTLVKIGILKPQTSQQHDFFLSFLLCPSYLLSNLFNTKKEREKGPCLTSNHSRKPHSWKVFFFTFSDQSDNCSQWTIKTHRHTTYAVASILRWLDGRNDGPRAKGAHFNSYNTC